MQVQTRFLLTHSHILPCVLKTSNICITVSQRSIQYNDTAILTYIYLTSIKLILIQGKSSTKLHAVFHMLLRNTCCCLFHKLHSFWILVLPYIKNCVQTYVKVMSMYARV
jgi:hypothetical protein